MLLKYTPEQQQKNALPHPYHAPESLCSILQSDYCGAYCVCFVLHVTDDVTYDKFIGHYYSDNLLQNDEILKHDFSNINFLVKM